ncbi:MAG: hypothetical protein KKC78_12470 [Proteobacteria bacterium]|nr:hypothetical protein [Pseudomonadota bacterium]
MSRPSLWFVCLIVLVCLGLAPSGAAAQAYRIHQDQSLAYSMEVPVHWAYQVQPGSQGRSLVFSGPQGSPEYRATLSLQIVDAKAFPGLEAVARELESQWSRQTGYRLLARQNGSLAGQSALRLLAAFSNAQGEAFRREQFICRGGPYYYLLAYTAPESIFAQGQAHRDRALASLRLLPPQQERERGESLNVAAYGPALLNQLAGPLYSPAFANGTPQGQEVARAHNRLIAELARALGGQAAGQKPVLAALERMGDLQTRQMALLESQTAASPQAQAWWARLKPLYKLQLNYALTQSAQRGMVEGALAGQAKPEQASQSLAAVQMLAALQLAVSDQQALILRENQELWTTALTLWDQMSGDQALPAAFRLSLAQFNQQQRELALELGRATMASNAELAHTVLVLRALELFSREVTRAYGAAVGEAIPRLRAQAAQLAQARPGDPAVQAVTAILDNLERTAGQIKQAQAPRPLGQRLAQAMAPVAWAGAWQFTKDFSYNLLIAAPTLAAKATANAGRFVASGMETSTKQVTNYLSYATYSPLRVTSDPQKVVGSVDEIIKNNPKMAKHRDLLNQRLAQMAQGHAANDLQGYMQLKKQTVDAAVAEYAKGEYGVRALKTGVEYIDQVKTMKVEPAAKWVAEKVTKGVLGNQVGGVLSPAAQGTASLLAGTAYKVVADLPKNVMVLMNPQTSYAEKGQATYELAGSVGASVLCYTGTAAALAGKVAPSLAAAAQGAYKIGAGLVSRMMPAGAQAAAQAATKMVAPVVQQVGRQVTREVAALLPAEAEAAKYAVTGISAGVQKLTAMAAQPVGATLAAETRAMVSEVVKNFTTTGTTSQILKAFASNFAIKPLLEGAANDSFSGNVLLPILQSAEAAANAKPASSGVSRSFNNSNLLKADQGKIERKFDSSNLQKSGEGFQLRAAAGAKEPEAKPEPTEKAKPEPVKARKETPAERQKRKDDLMAKAKRLAARQDNSVYSDPKVDSTQVIPETCTIDAVAWHPKYPENKWPVTYYIRGGQVTATSEHTMSYDKWCNKNWCCSPSKTNGTFSGSLMNNVITGTWKMTSPPNRCWSLWNKGTKGGDGKYTYAEVRCEYTQSSTYTMHNTLTLEVNGRLAETYTGSGTHSTSYGPQCWENMAGTTKTNNWNMSWDDPKMEADLRKPMTGVWELRKRPKSEEK